MKPFQRRTYGFKTFWREFSYTMRHRALIRQASRGGRVSEALETLHDRYGSETAQDILTVRRMIRMGTPLGNSWGYLRFRLSFGHFGLLADESRYTARGTCYYH